MNNVQPVKSCFKTQIIKNGKKATWLFILQCQIFSIAANVGFNWSRKYLTSIMIQSV